jgi:hypothetical protein
MGFVLLWYAQGARSATEIWNLADWLINYQGGFIRRGLIGQIIYAISGNAPNTLWITYALQATAYLILTGLTLKLFFLAIKLLVIRAKLTFPLNFTFNEYGITLLTIGEKNDEDPKTAVHLRI